MSKTTVTTILTLGWETRQRHIPISHFVLDNIEERVWSFFGMTGFGTNQSRVDFLKSLQIKKIYICKLLVWRGGGASISEIISLEGLFSSWRPLPGSLQVFLWRSEESQSGTGYLVFLMVRMARPQMKN